MTDYTERHNKRFRRMWWKIGLMFEARAFELAFKTPFDPDRAINFAKAAEACFWQATGEGDFTPLSKFGSKESE